MIKDPVIFALAVAFGLVLGWLMITTLWTSNRKLRLLIRKVGCKCGFHAPSGHFEPSIGARDIMRCDYCDQIIYEVKRTKASIRRIK